ncbi:hypothetical protein ACFCXS_01910 [Streptomyces sp. NPDC056373]|uniref:hypothetical protein n=1 Tax=Streptomyces sp. NPDC056373 TaxID=3345798 RepID=UPI0035D83F8F
MAWSAALPDAALRLPRTAAGWRALQLALMVGGLLVLGVLWGERASAENGAGALPEGRAGQVVSGVPVPGAGAGDRLVRSGGGAAEPVSKGPAHARAKVPPSSSSRLRSQSRPPERRSRVKWLSRMERLSHVKRPEPARTPELSEPPRHLSHAEPSALPEPVHCQALPDLPGRVLLPDLPGFALPPDQQALPGQQALPDLPGPAIAPGGFALPGTPLLPALPLPASLPLPELPGNQTLPGRPLPAPVTADPQPGGTTLPVPYTPVQGPELQAAPAGPLLSVTHPYRGGNVSHTGRQSHTARHTSRVGHAHHADDLSHSVHRAHQAHPSHPRPPSHAGPARAGHSPGGRPDGVLGNRSVADSGSSRHGDAHAVTPGPRAVLGLVPGAVARTDLAGARRTRRDIPLFPG